jgi:hypothetical protein
VREPPDRQTGPHPLRQRAATRDGGTVDRLGGTLRLRGTVPDPEDTRAGERRREDTQMRRRRGLTMTQLALIGRYTMPRRTIERWTQMMYGGHQISGRRA